MKILLIPQLSFRNSKNELDPIKDSNYVFNINLMKALKFEGHDCELILPTMYKDTIYGKIKPAETGYDMFVNNPFYSRFVFNFDEAQRLIEDKHPDIILENEPTKVMSWNALKFNRKYNFKVYTYNHWLDTIFDRKVPCDYLTYMYRQFEGHLFADKSGFNSNFAINLFLENAKQLFISDFEKLASKLYKLPPFVDVEEMDEFASNKKEDFILFNHRLSTLEYYNTQVNNLIWLLESNAFLRSKKIIFTNPTAKDSEAITNQLDAMGMRYEFVSLDKRRDYIELCSKANLGFCLFEHPGMWTISALEVGYYAPVIGLYHSGYRECIDKRYAFKSMDELIAADIQKIYYEGDSNREFIKTLDYKSNQYLRLFLES
jgi:hypothetical protein